MDKNNSNMYLQYKWFDSLNDLKNFVNTNKILKENVQDIIMKNNMSWLLLYWEQNDNFKGGILNGK